jgi:hypothetical protein
MYDILGELSEADVLALRIPSEKIAASAPNPWWEKFQYTLYDWSDPDFVARNKGKFGYLPIRLSQGYFMMVSQDRYEEMTWYPDGKPMSWHAHVKYNERGEIVGVYARRRGRVGFDDNVYVLAHRQLLGILDKPSSVGDHVNGLGLDNRCRKRSVVNLCAVSHGVNGHNTTRLREDDLPQGVERTGLPGNYRYNGKVCKRYGKKVVTIRSRKWKTPEPAARWYQNYLKRTHKRTMWAHKPESVNYPFFPPTKAEGRKARAHAQVEALIATF